MNLSYRLRTVASFVPKGSCIADIGTDHGYIPIYLAKEGMIQKALAMDVRKGPLERAAEHIREYGLEDRIDTRLSDGMKMLEEGEADTVVIAGMGGELMLRILTEGRHMWPSVKKWVLSPQSDIHKVRAFLRENGFFIEKEAMVAEEGKYYTIMAVEAWDENLAEKEGRTIYDYYGEYLIHTGNPVLREYLEHEKEQKEALLNSLGAGEHITEKAEARKKELEQELRRIKEAQDEMQ